MKYRASPGASALQSNLVTEPDDYLERPQQSLQIKSQVGGGKAARAMRLAAYKTALARKGWRT